MKKLSQICLWSSGVAIGVLLAGIVMQQPALYKAASLIAACTLAIGIGAVPVLKGFQYTAWIIAAVVAGMVYPAAFTQWGEFDLRNKWLILVIVQLVMFGMGIQMSIRDFTGIRQTGKGVLVGLICQFTVMPFSGLLLITVFDFEPEIAAGIILIGSCSSGLASNVMTYLARANLVLSVVVTAMCTLASPFVTPLMMKLLAGTLIEVSFADMMLEIIKIVIVPIGAALLHDYLKTATPRGKNAVMQFFIAGLIWLIALPLGGWQLMKQVAGEGLLLQVLEVIGFLWGAVVAGVLYHWLAIRWARLDTIMPYCSMFGIVYFTTVTTAAGRENLMQVGGLLFIAAVLHNAAGYFLGYWLARLFGLDKNSSRTIAFEVGLQNGGMASGIAGSMGKLGTVGLPAAVFSPWMNISGSILANYWRTRKIKEGKEEEKVEMEKSIAKEV